MLDGIRVLDFGRYIAGPWCAALLGDLGAEVIRIDKCSGSEDRFVGPVADGGEGALKGGLIGGAVGGAAVLATRGKEVEIPAGSRYKIELRKSLKLN